MDNTSIRQLLGYQCAPLRELDAAREIAEYGKHNIRFSIMLAISYGIILGKREERAKRKGKQS